jgi:hypothetical protein
MTAWKGIVILLVMLGLTEARAAERPVSHGSSTNEMKVIAKGAFSGIQTPKQLAITNETQWAEVWREHISRREPKPEPPKIDFSKQTVLFVGLGEKRTGGYGVEIGGIQREKDKTIVTVKTRKPKPGGFQIQAITAPFIIAAVPRIEGKAEFKVE